MNKSTIKTITAMLMISDGPESKKTLCEKFDINIDELDNIVSEINNVLEENNFGFHLKTTSENLDFYIVDDINKELTENLPESILKGLSAPALETLAIIAYEQPVTKLKISEIRGVDSDSSIKTLESRGLIQKGGELQIPGGPILYETTELFLQKMGIGKLEDLPRIGALFDIEEEE